MIIGNRLRLLRERKNFSQGDLEKLTGLKRFYVSRIENGHTVPSVETLEKFARALEVPLYCLFYEGETPPIAPLARGKLPAEELWGASGRNARLLSAFRRHLAGMSESDRSLLLFVAQKMAIRKHRESRTDSKK